MLKLDSHPSGRHFLQIPGPTNVPDRVLRAIDNATIDHRGPEFAQLAKTVLAGMKRVFRTEHDVVIYPASGTGAWEAALVNTLSPGDRVLMAETGQFATLWKKLAERLSLVVDFIPGDWRQGAAPGEIERRLRADAGHAIKAVCVVHNETSTGVTTPIAPIRAAIDRAGHPALLLVDTISSLGSIDYRHDEWGVDVTVGGSQKGLMLPPGLSFNAISAKALAASAAGKAAALLLGLEGDAGRQRQRLLSVHAGDQPAVRPARGARHAVRRRSGAACLRGTTALPRQRGARCAPGGSRSCASIRPSTARR